MQPFDIVILFVIVLFLAVGVLVTCLGHWYDKQQNHTKDIENIGNEEVK